MFPDTFVAGAAQPECWASTAKERVTMHPCFRLLSICLVTLLAACAASFYSPPIDGPTARIRVVANAPDTYFAWTRDTTAICSRESPNFPTIGGDSKADLQRTGIPGYVEAKGDRFERRIRAGVPISLGITAIANLGIAGTVALIFPPNRGQTHQGTWSCKVRASFTPREGASYELAYNFSQGSCNLSLAEVTEENGALVKIATPISVEPLTCATIGL